MVSSEATQAVCIVDAYALLPVQSGQLSRDVTKRSCRNRTHCTRLKKSQTEPYERPNKRSVAAARSQTSGQIYGQTNEYIEVVST
jgi:hypothetical protein